MVPNKTSIRIIPSIMMKEILDFADFLANLTEFFLVLMYHLPKFLRILKMFLPSSYL